MPFVSPTANQLAITRKHNHHHHRACSSSSSRRNYAAPITIPLSASASVPTDDSDNNNTTSPGAATPATPGEVTAASKRQLVRLLPALINLPKQTQKVASLIKTIEANGAPPLTAAFTLLAIAGRWRLLFSSALPAREGSGILRIRSIIQQIAPSDNDNNNGDSNSNTDAQIAIGGSLVNVITFSYDESRVTAKLTVACKFDFVKSNPARMHITLEGHQVQIIDTNTNQKMDQVESQNMVRELQKGVPAEIWDPSGITDTTFIEPDLRITRFVGKRLAGVRNIFVPEHAPLGRIPGGRSASNT